MSDKECPAEEISKYNATNGGRALNAVWDSDLPMPEKLILLYLGSQLDFNKSFTRFRSAKQTTIATKCSMHRTTVVKHLAKLESNGYIKAEERQDKSGQFLCKRYALTDKIFDEYVEKKQKPTPELPCSGEQHGKVDHVAESDMDRVAENNMDRVALRYTYSSPSSSLSSPASSSFSPSMDGWERKGQPNKSGPPTHLVSFIEACKMADYYLKGPKDFPDWEGTQLFMADIVDRHGMDIARKWGIWLKGFMMERKRSGLTFGRNVPWIEKLNVCWEVFEQQEGARFNRNTP